MDILIISEEKDDVRSRLWVLRGRRQGNLGLVTCKRGCQGKQANGANEEQHFRPIFSVNHTREDSDMAYEKTRSKRPVARS